MAKPQQPVLDQPESTSLQARLLCYRTRCRRRAPSCLGKLWRLEGPTMDDTGATFNDHPVDATCQVAIFLPSCWNWWGLPPSKSNLVQTEFWLHRGSTVLHGPKPRGHWYLLDKICPDFSITWLSAMSWCVPGVHSKHFFQDNDDSTLITIPTK